MTELKRCPFCGGKATLWFQPVRSYNARSRGDNAIIFASCYFCKAKAHVFGTNAEEVDEVKDNEWEMAADAWNRRA